MKVLIVFNHPAPYKVRVFNELTKYVDLDVIFERPCAGDRPTAFYNCNEYNFKAIFLKKGYFGKENTNTDELVLYLKDHYNDYDLVILNGYSKLTEIRAISYLKKNKLPFVLLINGGIIKKELLIKKLIKSHYIKQAAFYLSPCEEANKYLIHYKANPKNIFLYPYGTFSQNDVFEKPLTDDEKGIIRERLGLPKGRLFVSAGQFIARKNNIKLIKIFKKSKHSLLLIGCGKQERRYRHIIAVNKIKNVKLIPFMDKKELFEIMSCCDAFITLSKQDIFGHTTLEAMACGLPVISSKHVVSSLQYIKNSKNGYCINENDKNEVRIAMNNINSTMNQVAIETAMNNTIEKTAERYFEVFKEILKCE